MFKFNEMNIHMQSASSNKWGNRDDWKAYEAELVNRYSQEFLDAIEISNRDWPLKFTDEHILKEMERTITMMGMCPEQPDYYPRVKMLITLNATIPRLRGIANEKSPKREDDSDEGYSLLCRAKNL